MNSQAMTLRSATPADIPAMLSILLTSFRDFPLFDFVYSPLNQNIEHASDTIFFWGRRIEAAIYDPQSDVVVAECSPLSLDSTDAPTHNPSEMLNWVVSTGKLSQISTETGQLVVAFAIWRWKGGALSSNKIDTTRASLDYLKGTTPTLMLLGLTLLKVSGSSLRVGSTASVTTERIKTRIAMLHMPLPRLIMRRSILKATYVASCK